MFNPPVTVEAGRPLDEDCWQAVSPRYALQLRFYLLIYGIVLSAAPWLLAWGSEGDFRWHLPLSLAAATVFLLLILVWVPRRVRHTRYLLRQLDVHMQTGLAWRRTTSVAINRIQHLEITQGPLERMLGLSRLVLYTAGGVKSDLVLPGLPTAVAQALKAEILRASDLPERQEDQ